MAVHDKIDYNCKHYSDSKVTSVTTGNLEGEVVVNVKLTNLEFNLTKSDLVSMLTKINREEERLKFEVWIENQEGIKIGDTVTLVGEGRLVKLSPSKVYTVRALVADGDYLKFNESVGAFPVGRFTKVV